MFKSKAIAISAITFIFVAIPLTVYVVLTQRDQRSNAAVTYTLNSFNVLSGSESPVISGSKAVWTSSNAGPYRNIFLRDLATGVTTQITNGTKYFDQPDIDTDKVVYHEAGTNIIWYKNLTSGITKQLGIGWYPKVSGDRIVWWNYNFTNGVESDSVYLYNNTNSMTTLLPNTAGYVWNLSLEGTELVITGASTVDFYNLTNNNKIRVDSTTGTLFTNDGAVSGDYIVWQVENRTDSTYYIWDYKISTGVKARISSSQPAFSPKIDQNKVVWDVRSGSGIGFYIYDLTTNIERKIDPYSDRHYEYIDISAGKIIWLAYEGVFPYTEKIYVYEETSNPVPKIGDFNGDGMVNSVDLAILLSTWGSTTDLRADLNKSGKVDSADLALLLAHWGS